MIRHYGTDTGSFVDLPTFINTLGRYEKRMHDVVAPREAVTAVAEDGKFGFRIEGNGNGYVYEPTEGALRQISELGKMPLAFLRDTVNKYPAVARDMTNAWMRDNDVVNRVNTANPRKQQMMAERMKQLWRCFLPGDEAPATLRGVLSSKYRIVNNVDVAKMALQTIERNKTKVEIHGALTEDRMHLEIGIKGIEAEITYPGRGVGHQRVRVPCGVAVGIVNGETGLSSYYVTPKLIVEVCSNRLVATETLTMIHVGGDYGDMNVLSADTIRKMNETLMMRSHDILGACLQKESFKRIADMFSEHAADPIDHPKIAVENITRKFSLTDDLTDKIFEKFMGDGDRNRMGLAMAITAQAHDFREKDYEKASELEELGSKVLRMSRDEFGVFEVEDKKKSKK